MIARLTRRTLALGSISAVALTACAETAQRPMADSGGGSADGAPGLVAFDSVTLAESDSITLGTPNSFAVTPSGEFFVGDASLPKVVHYGRDGRSKRVVGRRGSGPGEYRVPSWVTVVGDTTVLVGNAGALEVLAFDTRTGALRWTRRFPAQTSSMYASGHQLYIGFAGGSGTGSLGVLDLPSGDDPTSARMPVSVTAIGPVPALFTRVPMAASVFGTVELAALGDTLASVYEVSNHLYLTSVATGTVIDSISIPPGSRRGARLDLFGAITSDQASAMAAFLESSIPFELARLSSGRLAYVAFDADQDKQGIRGRHYLSVVDVARRLGCADTRIPGAEQPPARVAFSGDTLFTLSQEMAASDTVVRTIVRAYRVDTADCRCR